MYLQAELWRGGDEVDGGETVAVEIERTDRDEVRVGVNFTNEAPTLYFSVEEAKAASELLTAAAAENWARRKH